MLKFSKKSLGVVAAIAAQAVLASSVSAAVGTGALVITGTFPAYNAVSVTEELYPGSSPLTDLSTIFGAYVNVGKISIGSNDAQGFKLTVHSDNTYQLHKTAGFDVDNAAMSLAYKFRLASASGALGTNVTAPTLTDLTGTGDKVLDFAAPGNDAAPTNIVYNVGITATAKALVVGAYSDTLTFSIAGL